MEVELTKQSALVQELFRSQLTQELGCFIKITKFGEEDSYSYSVMIAPDKGGEDYYVLSGIKEETIIEFNNLTEKFSWMMKILSEKAYEITESDLDLSGLIFILGSFAQSSIMLEIIKLFNGNESQMIEGLIPLCEIFEERIKEIKQQIASDMKLAKALEIAEENIDPEIQKVLKMLVHDKLAQDA
jgi:hypothetical protein